MTQITLPVYVSPSDAAAAGRDCAGTTDVVVRPSELSDAARDILSRLLAATPRSDGTPAARSCCCVWIGGEQHHAPQLLDTTTDGVHAWLQAWVDAIAANRAKVAAERETTIAELLALPLESWFITAIDGPPALRDHPRYSATGRYLQPGYAELRDPRIVARRAEADGALQPLLADYERVRAERAAATAQREAEAKAKAERRTAQLAAWVNMAPLAIRKRAARGLLPEADIIAGIRDDVFAPLADLPRYERMSGADVRAHYADAYGERVEFATTDAESATDDDIALIERIEAALPGCTCTLRVHSGWIGDDPDTSLDRYSVRVEVTVGELTLSREYAAR